MPKTMIIQPDFLEHWKTRALVDQLGDQMAPLYLIRLWGHCQSSKCWEFLDLPPQAVKAICRYAGDAEEFEKALTECRWILREGKSLTVRGWQEYNASLIASYENGKKGGRPKKNPSKTHGYPMGNPDETHAKPIREDKKGLDKKDESTSPKSPSGGGEYSNEFQEFWEAYPKKKGGKPKAFESYRKAVKSGVKHSEILSAVKAQSGSKDWLKDRGQFIPLPTTWLNQGRWEDELENSEPCLPDAF